MCSGLSKIGLVVQQSRTANKCGGFDVRLKALDFGLQAFLAGLKTLVFGLPDASLIDHFLRLKLVYTILQRIPLSLELVDAVRVVGFCQFKAGVFSKQIIAFCCERPTLLLAVSVL